MTPRRRQTTCRMLGVLFIGIALTTTPARSREAAALQSQWFPEPYLEQHDVFVLSGRIYGFFTHNSSTWDSSTATLYPTFRLNMMLSEREIPTISIVEGFRNGIPDTNHFLRRWQITYPVLSTDGDHNLLLPNARAVFLSGGYLEHCLARTIDALLDGTTFRPNDEPLLLVLVSDSIFVSAAQAIEVADSGNDDASGQAQHANVPPMSTAVSAMSDDALVDYITDIIPNEQHEAQDRQDSRTNSRSDRFTLRLFRDKRLVETVGNGPLTVDLVVLDTETLEEHLPDITRLVEGAE